MVESRAWPSPEIAASIHDRLCQDDPVASADFAEAYLNPLADWLRRTNSQVDPHFCEEAAGDAILTLVKNPRSYDPLRGQLAAYLRMSAQGDLRNLLEKESRHRSRRADYSDVELFGTARNRELDAEQQPPPNDVEASERIEREFLQAIAPGVVDAFSPGERLALTLLIEGERRTREFANVLGVSHLSESEQRREVKRVKDRIKQRLRRARSQT